MRLKLLRKVIMKPFCGKQGFADLMVVADAKRTEKRQRLASCKCVLCIVYCACMACQATSRHSNNNVTTQIRYYSGQKIYR